MFKSQREGVQKILIQKNGHFEGALFKTFISIYKI